MKIKAKHFGSGGFSYVYVLVFILVCFMFLSAGMTISGIFTRKNAAEKAVQSSLDVCAAGSLDRQYSDLIETESTGGENIDSSAYTAAFFTAMDSAFAHEEKSGSANDVTYTVLDDQDNCLFTLSDVSVQAAPDNMSMPDGKTERLVYTATATLKIPIGAFGFHSVITVPVKKTAAYQYAVSPTQ